MVWLGVALSVLIPVLWITAAIVEWQYEKLAVGLVIASILAIGPMIYVWSQVYQAEVRADCKSQGEQYVAKTKVFDDECKFLDERSGRWLDEDAWLYVTGLDD